jgi:XisH protein
MMPANDLNHSAVIHSLIKAGWSIIKEQYSLVIGENADNLRRLYIDILAQSQSEQIVLIEVKSLEVSPVHQFMQLIGQYVVYRSALDYLENDTPLYVAISEGDYETIVTHPLGKHVMEQTLGEPIPLVIYDTAKEEILRWIPPL